MVVANEHGEPFVNVVRLRVVDSRGRTCAYLQKQSYFDENGVLTGSESWGAPSKPMKGPPDGVASQPGRRPSAPVSRRGDHLNLELPKLTVNLRKITPVLDRFAARFGLVDVATGAAIICNDRDPQPPTLTIDDLRALKRRYNNT